MNASQNLKSGSSIEQHLGSINMSKQMRRAAHHDARIGEMFADAVLWVCGKVKRPRADVFAKPNLNY